MKSGWTIKKLGELGTIVRGKGIRRNETVDKGLPCIRYGEIYTSYNYIFDCPHSFVSQDVFAQCPKIKEGDVIFSLTGENKEEIAKALAYLGKDEIAAGGDLAIWSNHGCNPKFLAYMMYAPKLIEAKARASNGDIIVHASVKKMQEIEIPVPPLPEQKRIAAKIDAAFEKIDKMKANAERNLANAKELFQSTLDEAMRPKKGWVEKRLGEVCKVFGRGKSKHRPRNDKRLYDGPYPFIQTGDIRNAGHTIEKFTQTYSEFGLSQSKLWPKGTLCITIAANIAETAILGFEACFPDSVIGCVFDESQMHTGFAEYMLQNYRCQLQSLGKDRSSAQPNINLGTFEDNAFPVPPLAEQRQIVKRLDFLAEKIKLLDNHYTRQIADCAEMRQSVLREAFEGRL